MLFNQKNNYQIIYILIAFVCFFSVVFLLACNSPSKFFSSDTREGISLVRDDQELGVFYDRVSYYFNKDIPYKYSRIEYPPLAVAYLTVPAIFNKTEIGYRQALMGLNIVFALVLIFLTYCLLKTLGRDKRLLWLFILPSFIYFFINRFDIFPVVLVQLALLLLFKKRFLWSFLVLSLAFLAKGYAVVLFPIFFIYYLNKRKREKISLFKNKPLIIFILPIIIITAVICFTAGFNNGLFPYIFQSARNFAYGAIYLIYLNALQPIIPGWLWSGGVAVAAKVLLLLQIILPLIVYIGYQVFRKYIKTMQDVVLWSVLALLLYIQFSVYYSPQWFVWLLPLLVLIKLSKRDIIIVIAYDVLNYLFFPVALNYFGHISLGFDIIVFVRTILFVLMIIFIVQKIIKNNRNLQPVKKHA